MTIQVQYNNLFLLDSNNIRPIDVIANPKLMISIIKQQHYDLGIQSQCDIYEFRIEMRYNEISEFLHMGNDIKIHNTFLNLDYLDKDYWDLIKDINYRLRIIRKYVKEILDIIKKENKIISNYYHNIEMVIDVFDNILVALSKRN